MNCIAIAYEKFCKRRFPLPTEQQVADFEARIAAPLPPNYRRFLLEYNGGLFSEPDMIPLVDGCPLDGLTFMQGIGVADHTFDLTRTLYLFDDNYPVQILPIGYTLMGNLIFVVTDPDGDDYGGIGMKIASSDRAFNFGADIEEFFSRLAEEKKE
jgi:hypothetical protein